MVFPSFIAKRRIAASLTGVVFGFGLGFLPSCEAILTTFNPCGNILGFCSEEDIDLLFASIPDFDLDPTCTIPFATGQGCAGGPILPNPGPRP